MYLMHMHDICETKHVHIISADDVIIFSKY